MTSFGLGEIGIVVLLALLFFDARQVGKAARWLRNIRMKFFQIQRDWREQVDKLIDEEYQREALEASPMTTEDFRTWGNNAVRLLSPEAKTQAAEKITERLLKQKFFSQATHIAAYSSLPDELNTRELLQAILNAGKSLYLPYLAGELMQYARVQNLETDLEPGSFGILEPATRLRSPAMHVPDLILVPGRCFDESGQRIGRGKGYYDRYLPNSPALKVGVCFDVQISMKKLNMQEHDAPMDLVITEKRVVEREN